MSTFETFKPGIEPAIDVVEELVKQGSKRILTIANWLAEDMHKTWRRNDGRIERQDGDTRATGQEVVLAMGTRAKAIAGEHAAWVQAVAAASQRTGVTVDTAAMLPPMTWTYNADGSVDPDSFKAV